MTVGTGAAPPPGRYALTIPGVSGTLTHTVSVTLAVNPAPDFSLSANPASQSVVQGAGTTYTVSITPSGGFTAARSVKRRGGPGGGAPCSRPQSHTNA